MHTLLTTAAGPYVALAIAGVLIALAGLMQLEQVRELASGLRTMPGRATMTGRLVLGQLAALPLALLLLGAALNARGSAQTLFYAAALGVELFVGFVLPRRPLVRTQQTARKLRLLTPAFVAAVRVAKAGYDSNLAILERFVARPNPRQAAMQAVVRDALRLLEERRVALPFTALATVARARGCRELTDVAEALAHAEIAGHEVEPVLVAQEATLEALLLDEFQRQVARRGMYLLGMAAVGLIIGLFGGILWVVIAGSGVLGV